MVLGRIVKERQGVETMDVEYSASMINMYTEELTTEGDPKCFRPLAQVNAIPIFLSWALPMTRSVIPGFAAT